MKETYHLATKHYPTPSTLASFAQCPRFVQSPFSGTAADEGVLLHSHMEKIAAIPLPEWEPHLETISDLSSAQMYVLREAVDAIAPYFMMGRPVLLKGLELAEQVTEYSTREFIAPECRVAPFPGRRGFIDLLIRDRPDHAVVLDYKFGRNDSDFSYQIAPYVLEVFRLLPEVQSITCRIVSPRMDVEHAQEEYTREDIPRITQFIDEIVTKMQDPFSPGCPGAACARCQGNGRCIWQASSLTALTVTGTTDLRTRPVVPTSIILHPASPQERADRRDAMGWLQELCDFVKGDDKETITRMIQEGVSGTEVLPGYSVTMQRGRPVLDYSRLEEMNRSLMLTFGLSFETMLSCLEPVWNNVLDALSVPGVLPVDVEGNIPSRVQNEIALKSFRARYEVPGAPFPVVRKAGGRKAIGGRST